MSQGHIKTEACAIAVNPSSDGAVISSLEEPESGTQMITSLYVWLIQPSSEDLPMTWTQTATNAVQ